MHRDYWMSAQEWLDCDFVGSIVTSADQVGQMGRLLEAIVL